MVTRTVTARPNVHVSPVSESALYRRYPGQTKPQPCCVFLSCDTGNLGASSSPHIGGGCSPRQFHGHEQTWTIPLLTDEAASELLREIKPLAHLVCRGYSSEWDGSNHVARFTKSAAKAIERIRKLCELAGSHESELLQVWDAADWYAGVGDRNAQREALGITARTTDLKLSKLETNERLTAGAQNVHHIEGLARYLRSLRDEARDKATRAGEVEQ